MNNITKKQTLKETTISKNTSEVSNHTIAILEETRSSLVEEPLIKIPIAEIGLIGQGFASIIPVINAYTTSNTGQSTPLYRVINLNPGDKLLQAKDGSFSGSIIKGIGGKGFAKFQEVTPTKTFAPGLMIDPATLIMVATLYAIQQQLNNIQSIQEDILSFLTFESESELEADVETLSNIMSKFKYNWDNRKFLSSNHKMVLDIQRTARKHILLNRKLIDQLLNKQKGIINTSKVRSTYKEFERVFKYYRLALYSYSLSASIEVMISENYSEGHISEVIEELSRQSEDYRDIFTKSLLYLEEVSKGNMDINVLNIFGGISSFTGKVVSSIPFVNETEIDESLMGNGDRMFNEALEMENLHIQDFSTLSSPSNDIFINSLKELSTINNRSSILFDRDSIYFESLD